MKRKIIPFFFLTGILFAVIPAHLQAFSQATHLYIADHVFQDSAQKNDLYYGSIGPDIDFSVRRPEKWPTAFNDTHYQFVDLRSFASNPSQMAFADGWFTHNERDPWGADHYAHIDPGYVINKAKQLTSLPLEFAHLAIEVAVDVLLKDNEDPQLGEKLLNALQRHSSQDRNLLIGVFVTDQKRTDRLTLILAELSFRQVMVQYARALSLPDPDNKEALAKWGAMLAQRLYQMKISPDVLLKDLNDAIDLCKDDYKATVDTVIEGMKNNLK
jgi:hypothetical protein